MRADRLLSLLILLQTRGRMSASELAHELEVCERTIYRDVLALNTAGVPIYSETGRAGGFELVESYRTSLTGLSETEVRALFMLSVPQPLADLGMSQALKGALLKLQAALPERYQQGEVQVRQRLLLDSVGWEHHATALPLLATVQQAVWQDRCLMIRYATLSGVLTEQVVDPYALVAKAGNWYLIFARKGYFHARQVADLLEASLLETEIQRQADFNLPEFWHDWCAERSRSQQSFGVHLRVAARLLPFLGSYFGSTLQQHHEQARGDDAANQVEQDTIQLFLTFDSFESARQRLLGLGRAVEVLDPPELRCSLLDYARQILDLYAQRD